MKAAKFLMLMVFGMIFQYTSAQERYIDEIFTDEQIEVDSDVIYGRNATILPMIFAGAPGPMPEDLKMDVYRPNSTVDDATDRPVVVIIHGGDFLPAYANRLCWGDKTDWLSTKTAKKLARLGYVAVVPNYRLGWNPLATTPNEFLIGNSNGVIRATQDVRTAVRFLRKDVEEGSDQFGIDPSKVVYWGLGNGAGTVALNAGYTYTDAELATANYFVQDTSGNIVNVYEPSYFGDTEGKTVAMVGGDTTSHANLPNYSSEVSMVVSGAAVNLDTFIMQAGEPALVTVANPYYITHYAEPGPLNLPATGSFCCTVFFGQTYARQARNLGLNDAWKDLTFSNPIANQNLNNPFPLPAGSGPIEGFFNVAEPADTLSAWPWIAWDQATCAAADQAAGTIASTNSPNVLPTSSESKGLESLDKIVDYFAPRACVTLELGCENIISGLRNNVIDLKLSVYPNPSTGNVLIRTPEDTPMESITIHDLMGKTIAEYKLTNNKFETNLNLPNGIYIANIKVKQGIASTRIVLTK